MNFEIKPTSKIVCCICGKEIDINSRSFNNPSPFVGQVCCDECNLKHVVPARLNLKSLVGKTIVIIQMEGEPNYYGRTGVVEEVDDIGQLHGTWGSLAVVLGVDRIALRDCK